MKKFLIIIILLFIINGCLDNKSIIVLEPIPSLETYKTIENQQELIEFLMSHIIELRLYIFKLWTCVLSSDRTVIIIIDIRDEESKELHKKYNTYQK